MCNIEFVTEWGPVCPIVPGTISPENLKKCFKIVLRNKKTPWKSRGLRGFYLFFVVSGGIIDLREPLILLVLRKFKFSFVFRMCLDTRGKLLGIIFPGHKNNFSGHKHKFDSKQESNLFWSYFGSISVRRKGVNLSDYSNHSSHLFFITDRE